MSITVIQLKKSVRCIECVAQTFIQQCQTFSRIYKCVHSSCFPPLMMNSRNFDENLLSIESTCASLIHNIRFDRLFLKQPREKRKTTLDNVIWIYLSKFGRTQINSLGASTNQNVSDSNWTISMRRFISWKLMELIWAIFFDTFAPLSLPVIE